MSAEWMAWPSWLPRVLFKRCCPHCNSRQFKPAELRPTDELLAMFALKPARCVFCWRRAYLICLRSTW
jgi:hypothetical protein